MRSTYATIVCSKRYKKQKQVDAEREGKRERQREKDENKRMSVMTYDNHMLSSNEQNTK